jgi:uncharacterized membrane protein YvlD (DUF360 family)
MSPVSLAIKAALNCILVGVISKILPAYITIFGGLPAFVIIGCLLTLLNIFLRPALTIITFPLHLLFTLFTAIAVNWLFLWVVYRITLMMDPGIIAFTITGGITGWIIVSTILGIANWVMKHF